jgi:hypothetical protein
MHHYLARLSYNSSGWVRPTKEAQASEEDGTYNQTHGFGHEDWFFRNEWQIDGWRYGFVQAVNSSHKKLVKLNEPFDLTLFTIDEQKRRRYVARIHEAECLDYPAAEQALEVFKQQGWHEIMVAEIRAIGGNAEALGNAKWAKHVLNLRFRPGNVRPFPLETFARQDDPVYSLNRYTLTDLESVERKDIAKQSSRAGSSQPPVIRPYMRRAMAPIICTPEHARMQGELMRQLKSEYPHAEILREAGFIDVTVRTPTELVFFEIKTDLDPKSAMRQALGQILEYAFHPCRTHPLKPRLVIVGRRPLNSADQSYLSRLRSDFSLPLSYRVVNI